MRIDIRYLLPLLSPFAIYLFIRFFFWFAGVDITQSDNGFVAIMAFVVGIWGGGWAASVLIQEKREIGRINLTWWRK